MVEKAMDVLEDRSPHGFFLVIEGAYPDWLAHNLDLPGVVAEYLEFDEAVKAVMDRFGGDGETLIVATADHETSGLRLEGDPPYYYDVEFVDSVKCTADFMYGQLGKGWDAKDIRKACFPENNVTVGEVRGAIAACPDSEIGFSWLVAEKAGVEFYQDLENTERWDECDGGSHSFRKVQVYAAGPGSEVFDGITDNTEIGLALHSFMGSTPSDCGGATSGGGAPGGLWLLD